METVSARTDQGLPPVEWVVLPNAVNLAGLGLLTWGVAAQIQHLHQGSEQLVASVLLVVAVLSWIAWVVLRRFSPSWLSGAALVVMALAGGALAAYAPTALVFPAVAALGAAMRWPFPVAAAVGAVGWAAIVVGSVLKGHSLGVVFAGLAGIFAALLVGMTRQQAVERAEQVARMDVEKAKAEVERARAELLSERNHLARELHDVLAHTLAALSLQIEAFGTVVDSEPGTSTAVREQLERIRGLVHDGLDEARGAVHALREDSAPLGDQLARLCAQHDAECISSGTPRPLPPPVVLGLYRVAQEALTNVMKHATGAVTSVHLRYEPDTVSVTVENAANPAGTAPSSLASSGGGYGLRGITERLALLGGHVKAGPTHDGWRVAAVVPAAAAQPVG